MIPLDLRREMIDRNESSRSICSQCELLRLSRSTLYYTPSKAADWDIRLMEELDRLYLEDDQRNPENDQRTEKERL